MTGSSKDLRDLQVTMDIVARKKMMASGLDCELEITNGEMVLTANRAALLHIANRLVKLANEGVSGSHFTIDKADIAPDSETALTISLSDDA